MNDTADAEALGLSVHLPGKQPTPDYDVERADSRQHGSKYWKVHYADRQTLDRREKSYGKRDSEEGAVRFDGRARTSKHSAPLSVGFDVVGDDLFATRLIDAQARLEDLAAALGPLWSPFLQVACHGATMTALAQRYGSDKPGEAAMLIRIALEVATAQLQAFDEADSFAQYVEKSAFAVAPSRFLRQLAA